MFYKLALKSLWNRKLSVVLTIISIAISVALLISVDHLRREAKESFLRTVSGTDLIVGARSGQVNLLLYSVFRIGNPTNNISWDSFQELSKSKNVAWAIPISLGDSHKGFRVMGTTQGYFMHFRYGEKRALELEQGKQFEHVYDTVLGYQVAKDLGYEVGDKIILAHGLGKTSFAKHDDKPFTVSGILAPTGTPVDRTVHVSLQGIEAIHIGWESGTRTHEKQVTVSEEELKALTPKTITAVMLGLNSKLATFKLQRSINTYKKEALLAILPGVALVELWQIVSIVETLLIVIASLVVLAGLIGMLTTLLSSLNERRREMSILRAIGAKPSYVFLLLIMETIFLSFFGCLLGVVFVALALNIAQPLLVAEYGIYVSTVFLTKEMFLIVGIILLLSAMLGAIPAALGYRRSLKDGLTIRV